jgi:hypothetical protein
LAALLYYVDELKEQNTCLSSRLRSESTGADGALDRLRQQWESEKRRLVFDNEKRVLELNSQIRITNIYESIAELSDNRSFCRIERLLKILNSFPWELQSFPSMIIGQIQLKDSFDRHGNLRLFLGIMLVLFKWNIEIARLDLPNCRRPSGLSNSEWKKASVNHV